MDIVTHAGIGLIAAAPLLGSHPDLASGIVAGSVLPDLDALGRLCGKCAFLRIHQTWSHAIPVQVAVSLSAGCMTQAFGLDGLAFGTGLLAGLVFHTLLDYSNTLGVALLAPLFRGRFCLEAVFFIDSVVLMLTLVAGTCVLWGVWREGEFPGRFSVTYFAALAAYLAAKLGLRWRAGRLAPNAVSLIPSALWPWRFFGVVDGQACVRLFQLNVLTGCRKDLREQKVFDAPYTRLFAEIPEYALMRGLSPAYHVVNVRNTEAGELVYCRDLRTRNFGTTFGDLEVLLDSEKRVKRTHFHV